MIKVITKREQRIIHILNELSLKQQDILIRRFIKGETQEEVGKIYNMTNERIRQIESEALYIIKQN